MRLGCVAPQAAAMVPIVAVVMITVVAVITVMVPVASVVAVPTVVVAEPINTAPFPTIPLPGDH